MTEKFSFNFFMQAAIGLQGVPAEKKLGRPVFKEAKQTFQRHINLK